MKKEDIEFIKLIRTRPGGSMYIKCQYRIFFEKEIVLLHLQIVKEAPECQKMRGASQAEIKDNFIMNKEDQEEFFRGKGKKKTIEMLMRVKGIEGIKRLGCGQIPDSYVSHSNFTTIIIKGIEKRN